MERNGHKKLDLLKIDIEGAEYEVLNSIIEDGLDIKVLCVEFDEYQNPLDSGYRRRISDAITKLISYGYELIFHDGDGNFTLRK